MNKKKSTQEVVFDDDTITAALELLTEDFEDERTELIRTQYTKGESGNPNGRPPLPDVGLDDMLLFKLTKTVKAKLALTLINRALEGDIKAIMYIYDRMEGKPKQQVTEIIQQDDPLVLLLKEANEAENRATSKQRIAERPLLSNESVIEGTLREDTSEEAGT